MEPYNYVFKAYAHMFQQFLDTESYTYFIKNSPKSIKVQNKMSATLFEKINLLFIKPCSMISNGSFTDKFNQYYLDAVALSESDKVHKINHDFLINEAIIESELNRSGINIIVLSSIGLLSEPFYNKLNQGYNITQYGVLVPTEPFDSNLAKIRI